MRIAVISDIHANLEALTVCLKWIEENNIDKVICLGDLIDYCAQPNECVELIQNHCNKVILGNHDEGQFNYNLVKGYSEFARISSMHSRGVVKKEYVKWFETLPLKYSFENLLFVHASPHNPENYKYVLDTESAETNFNSFSERVCFIGHSHKPVIFEERNSEVKETDSSVLKSDCRYIINVGSVGQPRDYNPKLSFGMFDTDKFEYENVRLYYDIKSAADKIIKEGLPLVLAERLFEGR